MSDTQAYMGPIEVARKVGLTAMRIRQLADEGVIRPAIIGPRGARLFSVEDVERFAGQRETARHLRIVLGQSA